MKRFDAEHHLKTVILPYWNALKDTEYGGFYGFKTYDLAVQKKADKGVILHSRILWFYSNVYLTIGGAENLANARHAYEFIVKRCFDTERGGIYWMVSYDGVPADTTKNAYNQAFCIYALASYYRASGNAEALRRAYSLFECIETYCADEYGYLEAFGADWKTPVESAICDQGVAAEKTMNTLLHVLEAYTELFSADSHPLVGKKLTRILRIVCERVFNPEFERLETFFDARMKPLADIHSYGHDIEAAWLLDRAAEVLTRDVERGSAAACAPFADDVRAAARAVAECTPRIARKILAIAYDGQALNNESRGEAAAANAASVGKNLGVRVDTERIWWVQAESVVGFVNEYGKSGDENFLSAARQIYSYIENTLVDKRPGSEWFWSVSKDGEASRHGITEPWKCPYHNGRMCVELIRRGY